MRLGHAVPLAERVAPGRSRRRTTASGRLTSSSRDAGDLDDEAPGQRTPSPRREAAGAARAARCVRDHERRVRGRCASWSLVALRRRLWSSRAVIAPSSSRSTRLGPERPRDGPGGRAGRASRGPGRPAARRSWPQACSGSRGSRDAAASTRHDVRRGRGHVRRAARGIGPVSVGRRRALDLVKPPRSGSPRMPASADRVLVARRAPAISAKRPRRTAGSWRTCGCVARNESSRHAARERRAGSWLPRFRV